MAIQALILVGGLGTRLRPVVGDTPKPMAAVGGRPFLEFLVRQLRRDGFRDVVLLTGHGATAVSEYFGTGSAWDLSIAYSREPGPLGTGGALRHALPRLSGPRFLVMNGDSFFDIDLAAVLAAHARATPEPVATLALVRSTETERFGSVEADADGTVTAFREKDESSGPGLVNAGVYVIERSMVEAIPDSRPVSLEREVFTELVGRGLHAREFGGAFVDMGVPDAYAALKADPSRLLMLLPEAAR